MAQGTPSRTRDRQRFLRRDPKLAAVIGRLPACPVFPQGPEKRRSHFASLARAIVFQQLSGQAASTIYGRVAALSTGAFPTPAEMLALSEDQLRAAGLSRAKVAAVQDLAHKVQSGALRLRTLSNKSDDDVIDQLITVRGIGRWSAQMFLLFKLGRPDVTSGDDLGLLEGVRILDRLAERPKPQAFAARAQAWRPYRSTASWYLWRLVEHHRAS